MSFYSHCACCTKADEKRGGRDNAMLALRAGNRTDSFIPLFIYLFIFNIIVSVKEYLALHVY